MKLPNRNKRLAAARDLFHLHSPTFSSSSHHINLQQHVFYKSFWKDHMFFLLKYLHCECESQMRKFWCFLGTFFPGVCEGGYPPWSVIIFIDNFVCNMGQNLQSSYRPSAQETYSDLERKMWNKTVLLFFWVGKDEVGGGLLGGQWQGLLGFGWGGEGPERPLMAFVRLPQESTLAHFMLIPRLPTLAKPPLPH